MPGMEPRGSVSTTFDHSTEEHASFCLTLLDDPRRVGENGCGDLMLTGALPESYQRELAREWASNSVVVVGQEVSSVGPLWRREMSEEEVKGMVLLREPRAVRSLPLEEDSAFPPPPDYDEATPRWEWMAYGMDCREKERLPVLREEWEGGYTATKNLSLNVEVVLRLPRSLKGKGLALLVITGLRSCSRYHGPDLLPIEEVEEAV
ncbi:hypothetical protein N657DRAFT_668011 [Parathielavia appendiculata]|uniref:Uncharacterized protein n=1 Tax=Parathielavia appendiculata TaxID=2587402 RepID=A0AAN6UA52_9PEZI|nr:hypothetical protein N657DRAFT_668011 [Parathielavia appendiculata]